MAHTNASKYDNLWGITEISKEEKIMVIMSSQITIHMTVRPKLVALPKKVIQKVNTWFNFLFEVINLQRNRNHFKISTTYEFTQF